MKWMVKPSFPKSLIGGLECPPNGLHLIAVGISLWSLCLYVAGRFSKTRQYQLLGTEDPHPSSYHYLYSDLEVLIQ